MKLSVFPSLIASFVLLGMVACDNSSSASSAEASLSSETTTISSSHNDITEYSSSSLAQASSSTSIEKPFSSNETLKNSSSSTEAEVSSNSETNTYSSSAESKNSSSSAIEEPASSSEDDQAYAGTPDSLMYLIEIAKKVSINDSVKHGTMTDSRDGKVYKTITFMGQTWMAENLNYTRESYGEKATCYKDDSTNCEKYGRLYTQDVAMASACPDEWELPSYDRWDELYWNIRSIFGENAPMGAILKSREGWTKEGFPSWMNGLDLIGFNVIPAGFSGGSYYSDLGSNAYFWTATDVNRNGLSPIEAYNLEFYPHRNSTAFEGRAFSHRLSVRCIKKYNN